MSLSTEARHCGTVYVIRCRGGITAGEQSHTLEMAISRGLTEFRRLVIDLGGVTRLDSSGIGLMVRYLSHTRSRGGDVRLSTAPPFLADLLRVTRLTTVFKVYDSEEEAILSFLKEPLAREKDSASSGPGVLFIDRSSDLCAFARAFLSSHGFNVSSTCRTHDARLLLLGTNFDYVVVGPESSQTLLPPADVLKGVAHKAVVVHLPPNFRHDDPERAGTELLHLLQRAKGAGA